MPAVLRLEESGMHRPFSSVERIRDTSGVLLPWKDPRCIARPLPYQPFFSSIRRAKLVTRKPPSIARRHSLPPDWTAPQASNPPPARSVNTPSQDTA
jgi:hypothetical protein